jgi:aminopeptidase N
MRTEKLFLSILLVAGCSQPSTGDSSLAIESVTNRSYDAVAYDLKAKFDWKTRLLTATEEVTVVLQGTQKVELDSRVQVSRVHLGNLNLPFTQGDGLLTVDVSPLKTKSIATFTVEYTTNGGDSLIAAPGGGDGDPVKSHVVFTDSEPDRGSYWLVANHHPADRALWAVAITVPAGEDVIANGDRLIDVTADGERTVGYAMPLPIPTYLMAFAAGELIHADRQHGRIPLSVWYRKGLVIDPQKNLDAVEDAMTTFEKLLGPYPWDRYSVVVLPAFPEGGMENVTITFNYEQSGQGLVDFETNAHELSHHWFGDWVTMHDFDDVWFKEGMATVLQVEADRARRDQKNSGRLFGNDFLFQPTDAIVDDSLLGLAKYTSGPYQRAAWMINQIRDRVGEKNFWASLRKVLQQHALGSITGPQFIQSFAPALDDKTIQQLIAALPQKAVPQLTVAATPGDTATSLTLTLTDPSGQMISPPRMNVIGADGTATPANLVIGTPLTVSVPAGGYLAPDEKGVHPLSPYSFNIAYPDWFSMSPLFLPSSGAALTAFENRSPSHQELALNYNGLTQFQPAQYQALHDAMTSLEASSYIEDGGCYMISALSAQGLDTTAWTQAILPSLKAPTYERFTWSRGACGTAIGALFQGELTADAAATTAANAARVDYLMSFDYGVAGSLAAISNVATTTPSEQLRLDADSRFVGQAAYWAQYSPVTDPADVTAWQTFLNGELAVANTDDYHLETLWSAVMSLGDLGALPYLATQLHQIGFWHAGVPTTLVCDAYALSMSQPGSWDAFAQAAQPWSTLPAEAQPLVANPATCWGGPSAVGATQAQAAFKKSAARPRVDGTGPRIGAPRMPLRKPL